MTQELENTIRQAIFCNGDDERAQFANRFGAIIEEFVKEMIPAVGEWGVFNSRSIGNEDRVKISNLIFCCVNGHIVAMSLLLAGHVIPSGNAQRQVLEAIAMAILASKPNLGFLERFSQDRYSTNYAIRDVLRNVDGLNVNKDSMHIIKEQAKYYHQFSHPTLMTIALNSSFSDPENTYLSGFFDKDKIPQYEKEIIGRVKLAKTLPNLIQGIESNFNG